MNPRDASASKNTWKTHQSINQYYDIHKTVNKGFFGVKNFWALNFRILRIKFPGFPSHFWKGLSRHLVLGVDQFFRIFLIFLEFSRIFRIVTKNEHFLKLCPEGQLDPPVSNEKCMGRKMSTFSSCVPPWYTLRDYLLSSELHVLCLSLNKLHTKIYPPDCILAPRSC